MEEFLRHYGLWALYLGMWIEGETVLVLAGFLIHQDLMEGWLAYPVALLGALSVDSFAFGAGRWSRGSRFVKNLFRKSETVVKEKRLGWATFFGVRFLYGTRTPYFLYAGTSKLPWPDFFLKDAAAVAVWTLVWLTCGHFLGHLLALALGEIERDERAVVMGGILVAGSFFCGFLLWRMLRRKRE